MLEDPDQRPWFSAASLWEIAIKRSLGRADFDVEPRRLRRGLLDHGWNELTVTSEHAVAAMDLPPLHKDPFDRMLIAQAHVEGFYLVTSDDLVAQYPGRIRRM
jgi:PIN domain nuclease of toxin-antitoxin system